MPSLICHSGCCYCTPQFSRGKILSARLHQWQSCVLHTSPTLLIRDHDLEVPGSLSRSHRQRWGGECFALILHTTDNVS